jgi:hypothetical protein
MPPVIRPVWATPSEVQDITGARVTDADVVQAEAVIDALTGAASLDVRTLSRRNSRMLKLAACYQAAWMKEQFDLHARHDVTSISQEGTSASARDETTFVLAPLAKLALRRATWGKTRTVLASRPDQRRIVDPVVSDAHPWGRRI